MDSVCIYRTDYRVDYSIIAGHPGKGRMQTIFTNFSIIYRPFSSQLLKTSALFIRAFLDTALVAG